MKSIPEYRLSTKQEIWWTGQNQNPVKCRLVLGQSIVRQQSEMIDTGLCGEMDQRFMYRSPYLAYQPLKMPLYITSTVCHPMLHLHICMRHRPHIIWVSVSYLIHWLCMHIFWSGNKPVIKQWGNVPEFTQPEHNAHHQTLLSNKMIPESGKMY